MSEDLRKYLNISDEHGRACLLIAANGREHEVAITQVGMDFVTGYIAHWLRVCLYEPTPQAGKLAVLIDKPTAIQREIYDPGKFVLLNQECFIKSQHKFIANIKEISAIDLIDCPYLTEDPRLNGIVNEALLLDKIPQLREYYVEGQGFVSNPAAVAKPLALPEKSSIIRPPLNLKLK